MAPQRPVAPLLPRAVAAAVLCLHGALADVYMHNPRGSNNKLSEQSNNAQNQNRLLGGG
jgi:hypothetical protein